MRPRLFVVALPLLALLAACVEGRTDLVAPEDDAPGHLRLALAPSYSSALSSAASVSAAPASIRRIRLTARRLDDGTVLVRSVLEVDPDAESWDVPLEIPVPDGAAAAGQVNVLVELLSVEGGEERVEWSGVAGPFTLRPGQQVQSDAVSLYRGPPENLDVRSVRIEGAPLELVEGAGALLGVVVEGAASPTLFWGSLDPSVATVDALGRVEGVVPGATRIVAEAGPHADTAEVRVRPRVDRIRLTVGGVETDAVEVDALHEELSVGAQALDVRGAPVPDTPFLFSLAPAGADGPPPTGALESLGGGDFRTVAPGAGDIVVTVPGHPGVEARLSFRVFQAVAGVEVVPGELRFTFLGEEQEAEARAWDRNGVEVAGAPVEWSITVPDGDAAPAVLQLVGPGLVRAVGDGHGELLARVEGASASARLVVERTPASITIEPASVLLTSLGERRRLVVEAQDAGGGALPGRNPTWSNPAPEVVGLEPSSEPFTVEVLAVAPGETTLVAQVGDVSAEVRVQVVQRPFALRLARPGAPTGIVGEAVAELPLFSVLDEGGSPVPGVAVGFRALPGGAVTPAVGMTDADGRTGPTRWTLGSNLGRQLLRVSVEGLEAIDVEVEAEARQGPTDPGPDDPPSDDDPGPGTDFHLLGADAEGDPAPVLFTRPVGGTTWTPRASPVDRAVLALATNGAAPGVGLLVAAGEGTHTLATSTDGVTWTPRANPLTTAARGVAWGNPLWVAVGEGTAPIATSADGIAWNARAPPGPPFQGHGVAYGDGLWVAVGEGQTVLTSGDGASWTGRSPAGLHEAYAVAWNGSRWLVGGRPAGGGEALYTSRNGVSWSAVSSGFDGVRDIAWNGVLWVAVGEAVVSGVPVHTMTSVDGLTWEPAVSDPPSGVGRGVAWDGDQWWALREPTLLPGGSTLVSSPAGQHWTASEPPGPHAHTALLRSGVALHPFPWNRAPAAAITSHTGQVDITEGDAVTLVAQALDPEDGFLGGTALTWTSSIQAGVLGTGTAFPLGGLIAGTHSITVTAQDSHGARDRARILVVVDPPLPPPPTEPVWLAVGADDAFQPSALSSVDGATWTTGPVSAPDWPERLAYGAGRWVGMGNSGLLTTSTDGLTWTPQSPPSPEYLSGAVWNGTRFVMVGTGGLILVSDDGELWSDRPSGTAAALNGVAWNGAHWMAVGTGGTVVVSEDGDQWIPRSTGTGDFLAAVAWNGTHWMAVGNSGAGLVSTDGLTWTPNGPTTAHHLIDVAWTGTHWVVASLNGSIWTSVSPSGGSWLQEHDDLAVELYSLTSDGLRTFVGGFPSLLLERVGGAWQPLDTGDQLYLLGLATRNPVPVNAAPSVQLVSPTPGSQVDQGQLVTFEAAASDPEDGALGGGSVTWESDLDGTLGTGALLTTSTLSVGSHTITLTAADMDEAVARIVFDLDVVPVGPVDFALLGAVWDTELGQWDSHLLSSEDAASWTPRLVIPAWWGNQLRKGDGDWLLVGPERTIHRSLDGRSWIDVSPAAGPLDDLYDAAYGNGRWVAVGGQGSVFTSPNGTAWTAQSSGTPHDFMGIGWNGAYFTAVGLSGTIFSSTDGMSWTEETSPVIDDLQSVTWGRNRWVAVGESGVMLWSDDGMSWTEIVPGGGVNLYSVLWDGDAFLASGQAGTLLQSFDGATWTAAPGFNGAGADFWDLTWSNDRVLAVGETSGDGILRLRDDGVWTDPGSLPGLFPFTVAGATRPTVNGAPTLTITSHAGPITMEAGAAVVVKATAVDPEEGALPGSTLDWWSSLDGFLSTADSVVLSTLSIGTHTLTVTAADSLNAVGRARVVVEVGLPDPMDFLLYGDYTNGSTEYRLFGSSEGSTWPQIGLLPVTDFPEQLIHGDGRFLALTQNRGILSSTDGVSWTDVSPTVGPAGENLVTGVYGGDRWVVLGVDGGAYISLDGVSWAYHSTGVDSPTSVVWNGSLFIALRFGNTVVTSPDGETWTEQLGADVVSNGRVAWSGREWVAVGQGGVIRSENGIDWSASTPPVTLSTQRVVWTGGEFMIVGQDGPTVRVLLSLDGVNWVEDASGSFTGTLWTLAVSGDVVVLAAGTPSTTVRRHADGAWTTVDPPDAQWIIGVAGVNPPTVNLAPMVTITSHAGGLVISPGDPVILEATAVDADGPLDLSDLVWESSLVGGVLGTGPTLPLAGLLSGVHTITVSIEDADGAVGWAQIQVDVQFTEED